MAMLRQHVAPNGLTEYSVAIAKQAVRVGDVVVIVLVVDIVLVGDIVGDFLDVLVAIVELIVRSTKIWQ